MIIDNNIIYGLSALAALPCRVQLLDSRHSITHKSIYSMESKPLNLLSLEEMHAFLSKNNVSAEVLTFLEDNGVTGAVFLELTGDDLNEFESSPSASASTLSP